MRSREVLEDANILMDAEMMDAVVGGANCTDSCKKGCKSQCKHACATSSKTYISGPIAVPKPIENDTTTTKR